MISIIFPTLNEENFIGHSIRTLKDTLTAFPYEIIVSDGKSTDKTVEIARQNGAQVVEYAGEKRQTIAQGRNDGAKVSKGDYLVFMDADCTIPNPNAFFTKTLKEFDANPRLTALTTRLLVTPGQDTLTDRIVSNSLSLLYRIINNVLHIGISWGEFEMIRRKSFYDVGGFQEHLTSGEDGDMFFRLSKIGRTKLLFDLRVFHSGRRAHKVGWPYLLSLWFVNSISLWFRNKSIVKEWSVIR